MDAGHPCGDMGEDQVFPAEIRDQPVARGQIDARPPFFLRDTTSDRSRPYVLRRVERFQFQYVHVLSPWLSHRRISSAAARGPAGALGISAAPARSIPCAAGDSPAFA